MPWKSLRSLALAKSWTSRAEEIQVVPCPGSVGRSPGGHIPSPASPSPRRACYVAVAAGPSESGPRSTRRAQDDLGPWLAAWGRTSQTALVRGKSPALRRQRQAKYFPGATRQQPAVQSQLEYEIAQARMNPGAQSLGQEWVGRHKPYFAEAAQDQGVRGPRPTRMARERSLPSLARRTLHVRDSW